MPTPKTAPRFDESPLYEKLLKLVERAGVEDAEIIERTGIDRTAWNRFKRRERTLAIWHMESVARLMGYRLDFYPSKRREK